MRGSLEFKGARLRRCIVLTNTTNIAGKDLPIAVTGDIGHRPAAKAIMIGEELHLAI